MARRTSTPPAPPAAPVPIVLYTRAACHLCEEMKAELERSGLIQPGALREVDVDRHPALAARYGSAVPVLAIGGRVAYRGRIRPGTLRRRFGRLVERWERAGPVPTVEAYSGPIRARSRALPANHAGDEVPTQPVRQAPARSLAARAPRAGDLRILLVDDHELVRSALAGALELQQGFEIAGVAASASEAIERCIDCSPDLVVMDIDMPGMICFDAVERMRAARPGLGVIFLSAYFHDHHIEQALRVGANGYVVKGGALEHLYEALREVAGGGDYFSPQVRSRLLEGALETRASALTAREEQVLRYLARGLSKKEVARTMQLSVKTIEHHAAGLMRKLDIHDRVELTRYAIREGLADV